MNTQFRTIILNRLNTWAAIFIGVYILDGDIATGLIGLVLLVAVILGMLKYEIKRGLV
jgi:hypothetical protein